MVARKPGMFPILFVMPIKKPTKEKVTRTHTLIVKFVPANAGAISPCVLFMPLKHAPLKVIAKIKRIELNVVLQRADGMSARQMAAGMYAAERNILDIYLNIIDLLYACQAYRLQCLSFE